MSEKRGISEVISWVLLITLTVTLATIVAMWMTQHTKDIISTEIEKEDYLCDDVAFNVRKWDATLACDNPDFKFTIRNTGSFTI
ncbi:MAG: hypothetical protein AABX86_01825, partial [Nanoarchaeota archaeon]